MHGPTVSASVFVDNQGVLHKDMPQVPLPWLRFCHLSVGLCFLDRMLCFLVRCGKAVDILLIWRSMLIKGQ